MTRRANGWERRTERIRIMMSASEKTRIEQSARDESLTASAWCRQRLLGEGTPARMATSSRLRRPSKALTATAAAVGAYALYRAAEAMDRDGVTTEDVTYVRESAARLVGYLVRLAGEHCADDKKAIDLPSDSSETGG